jgi:mono/diheme cytochrome c family protein
MLAASFVDDKSRLAKSDAELLNSIKNGVVANGKVMPPQKDVLSDTEMRDVLAYIRKTFGD